MQFEENKEEKSSKKGIRIANQYKVNDFESSSNLDSQVKPPILEKQSSAYSFLSSSSSSSILYTPQRGKLEISIKKTVEPENKPKYYSKLGNYGETKQTLEKSYWKHK